jgi:hypothetical protein
MNRFVVMKTVLGVVALLIAGGSCSRKPAAGPRAGNEPSKLVTATLYVAEMNQRLQIL